MSKPDPEAQPQQPTPSQPTWDSAFEARNRNRRGKPKPEECAEYLRRVEQALGVPPSGEGEKP